MTKEKLNLLKSDYETCINLFNNIAAQLLSKEFVNENDSVMSDIIKSDIKTLQSKMEFINAIFKLLDVTEYGDILVKGLKPLDPITYLDDLPITE